MLETLLQKDTELLIFLNSLGSEQWDGFWLALTNQFHWSPLFALILFLIFKKFGWKNGLLMFRILRMGGRSRSAPGVRSQGKSGGPYDWGGEPARNVPDASGPRA